MRAGYQPSDAVLLDRAGQPLRALRLDLTAQRAAWTAFDDISPALVTAIITAEDQNFMTHSGVDLLAMGKAAWENLFRSRPRGASTITMQLASQLDPALQPGAGGRTLGQKWNQMKAAREIEDTWSKRDVLEAYLNLVPFRGELRGIGAGSRGLFGKAPSGLDKTESAILAALVRSPSAPPKLVARRACALAQELKLTVACAAVTWETEKALSRPSEPRSFSASGAVARQLLKPGKGAVRSTLDAGMQRFAEEALRRQLSMLGERNVNDGALVVLDNASGEILAWVANAGNSDVDGVTALRQAGSTLKPFLYELAFERRVLTAASILNDAPIEVATVGGMYVPQNYEKDFKGPVSARTSLASSLNIPAVRTLMLAGLDRFHERLRTLGIRTLTEAPDYYGYSLALGSGEITLLDLANAYRALANHGLYGTSTLVARPTEKPQRVMDEKAVFIVSDILSDRAARSLTFGLRNELATGYWAAVKTGTSKDMRDNWAVGYSDRYTVCVWVGNFNGRPMWDVSGVTGAAPVWRDVMDYLHRSQPSLAPRAPQGVTGIGVAFEPAVEPPRNEWFIAGTEMARVAVVPLHERAPRIVYPAPHAILAADPDIPDNRERVFFHAEAGQGLRWQLDGAILAEAEDDYRWQPIPGKHTLQLIDSTGHPVAQSDFTVRGTR
ncbi:penicillin-binding protein 1C [Massilia arenosa]|uniref:peptidoglycan glycosyltransferase n=1 Tax=Zemynaea arenosa TaxID=2561931 RepID=A0A4Y9RRB8_9BURK|nr:penicillin-binding protein 1C [Massilia arenosa]